MCPQQHLYEWQRNRGRRKPGRRSVGKRCKTSLRKALSSTASLNGGDRHAQKPTKQLQIYFLTLAIEQPKEFFSVLTSLNKSLYLSVTHAYFPQNKNLSFTTIRCNLAFRKKKKKRNK